MNPLTNPASPLYPLNPLNPNNPFKDDVPSDPAGVSVLVVLLAFIIGCAMVRSAWRRAR